MRLESVTSAQNPKIKEALTLQEKSKFRREKGLFIVEGRRELEHCINAGFNVRTLFLCPDLTDDTPAQDLIYNIERVNPQCLFIEIPAHLYNKLAYRGSTEGIIAEIEYKSISLEEIKFKKNPLIIVLESVEKPGNLGAILRSADASGADAVIICDPLTDIYNPNLIRSSIGAVFTTQVVAASSEDTIKWLSENGINIFTAQLQDSKWYYDTDMTLGTAIVMGTEAEGLSTLWREAATSHIKIPMLGKLDSLNVSVSAAILLYEAVKQRKTSIL